MITLRWHITGVVLPLRLQLPLSLLLGVGLRTWPFHGRVLFSLRWALLVLEYLLVSANFGVCVTLPLLLHVPRGLLILAWLQNLVAATDAIRRAFVAPVGTRITGISVTTVLPAEDINALLATGRRVHFHRSSVTAAVTCLVLGLLAVALLLLLSVLGVTVLGWRVILRRRCLLHVLRLVSVVRRLLVVNGLLLLRAALLLSRALVVAPAERPLTCAA